MDIRLDTFHISAVDFVCWFALSVILPETVLKAQVSSKCKIMRVYMCLSALSAAEHNSELGS